MTCARGLFYLAKYSKMQAIVMWNLFIIWVQLIIFIILLGFYFSLIPNYFDSNYLSLVLLIMLISSIFFTLRKKNNELTGNYFTITFIFILSFSIVHFQFYLDYALLLRSDLAVSYYLDYTIVPKAITLAALAMVSFFIGNVYSCLKPHSFNSALVPRKSSFSLTPLIFIIFILFVLFIYFTPLEYFKGGYGDLSIGLGYLSYKINHFFQISLWAYIICNIILISETELKLSFVSYLKRMKPSILFIIGFYFFLNILAGDRGPIINISILLFSGYLVSQKKTLNLRKMILIVLIGGFLLQFISFFRETDGNIDLSQRIESAIVIKNDISDNNESSVLPVSVELAKSLRAYHAAVMDQENNDILYGSGNLGYLFALIPGLGALIQSATSIEFSGSASYLTDVLGADHGLGTTALADVYLNYGFFGSLFIFLFFGHFFARLDLRGYGDFVNNTLLVQVLFLLFLSSALYLGRSTFAIVFSDVVLVYVLIKVSSGLRKISN